MGDKYAKRRRPRSMVWILVLGGCFVLYMLFPSGPKAPHVVPRLRPIGSAAQRVEGIDVHEPELSSVVHSIRGKRVVVVDNAIPERERKRVADRFIKLTGSSAQDGWHREKASDLSLDHNAMAKDMTYEECDAGPLSVVRTLVPHFYDQCDVDKPVWVTRCSIYMQTFIDIDEAHEDRQHDSTGFSVTAIWYPHERWHAGWGGETVFLSRNAADSDLLLPVLPKPSRLLLFDSEIPHMAKPTTPIAEPFRPGPLAMVSLPSTRTTGNRFSFVLRVLCARQTVDEMVHEFDTNRDNKLSRQEVTGLFRKLEIDRVEFALQCVFFCFFSLIFGNRRLKLVSGAAPPWSPIHLAKFFDVHASGDVRLVLALLDLSF